MAAKIECLRISLKWRVWMRWVCMGLAAGLSFPYQGGLAQEPDSANKAEFVESSEYAKGIEAFAEGDFLAAADLWLTDAYLGVANAQFNVGVLYIEGKGLAKDRDEGVFWFTKAARQGHVEAQYNLGHLLLEEQKNVTKIRRRN